MAFRGVRFSVAVSTHLVDLAHGALLGPRERHPLLHGRKARYVLAAAAAGTARTAHTRTRAYVCNPMKSPREEIPRKAGCRLERTTKRLQMEASIIAHAWLTPANFS